MVQIVHFRMPWNLSFPSVAWVNTFVEFTEFGIWWTMNRCTTDLVIVMDEFIAKVFFFLSCLECFNLVLWFVISCKILDMDCDKVHSEVEWQVISQENGAFDRTHYQSVVPEFSDCTSNTSPNWGASFEWGISCFVVSDWNTCIFCKCSFEGKI